MDRSKVDEITSWCSEQKCRTTVEALQERGFTAVYCATAAEVSDYILGQAGDAKTVGFGGSLSVAELGVSKTLRDQGREILNHGYPDLSLEERIDIMRRQQVCDLFLTGTNAVTTDGCLVNIDGIGNRVSAMMFGPKKVIVVAGRNKVVEGGVEEAIHRIKCWASPTNAYRLGKKTPCATTGFCADCDSPERICRATVILERKPSLTDLHVLVVNQDFGL